MTEDLCKGTSDGRAERQRRGEVKFLALMARRTNIDFVEFIVRDLRRRALPAYVIGNLARFQAYSQTDRSGTVVVEIRQV